MSYPRILAAFLALVMLFTVVLTSCNTLEGNGTTETTATSPTESASETESHLDSDHDSTTEVGSEFESEPDSDSESEPDLETETTESSQETTDTAKETTDTTEETTTEEEEMTTEETTDAITDVMIGEILEAEPAADFSVSRVFSDDMVVQRGEHIRVWGFAPESENGKKVSGEFKGMFAEAIIENGEWCIQFGARLEADVNGAEMKIYAGDNKTVTFTGVLVGDVYMIVGQSNVEYAVITHINNTDPTTQGGGLDAIDPNSIIRLNRNSNSSGGSYDKKGTDYVYKDAKNSRQWTKTTSSDTQSFSALGYYFARKMVENTDGKVPVGVIEFGFSGAPLGSYLPNEIAEKHQTDTLSSSTGKFVTTGVNSASSPGRFIYNCYMAPFEKYAIAGLIWYQGESNNTFDEAVKYNDIFCSLMTYMRETHNVVNKDFPVFVVEFPSIYSKPINYSGTSSWHYMDLGIIRSYMGAIPTLLDNSYVSVSNDLWKDKTYPNSLHPNCKYEQAERLATLANAVIFGNLTLEKATGPVFDSVTLSEDKRTATITFTNVGEGLTTINGNTAVQGIVGFSTKILGLHATLTPISAEITAKNQITVTFAEEIKALAYNFASGDLYGETLNLCNSEGCPASAFITPFTDISIDNFAAKDFVESNHNSLGLKRKAFDTLTADGTPLFTTGGIEGKLNAAGNKVEIYKGTQTINCYGWVGFAHPILMFGYSIDGGMAVLKSLPLTPEDAVLELGGKHALRVSINVDVMNLTPGDHTVSLLALVDVNGGTVAKILTFKVTVVDPNATPSDPEIPEGLDAPMYNAEGYGFIRYSFDLLSKDNSIIYTNGGVANKLRADGNKVEVAKGTKTLRLYGWIGYKTSLDKYGWAVDGNAVINTDPMEDPGEAILEAGGEHARRFNVFADISGLEVGSHTFDLLVRINIDGGQATLIIHSFTLIVTE